MKRLCVLLVATTGCSALANVEAGYAHAIAKNPEQAAVALNANAGIGSGASDGSGGGAGAMFRVKLGPNVQQVALGPMGYVGSSLGDGSKIAFAAMGGFHLLQLDNVHTTSDGDSFSFAIGSPVAEAFMFIRPAWMSLSIAGEYDLRFSRVPNTGYVSFLIGFGAFAAGSGGIR
jgi:hypothetical protein